MLRRLFIRPTHQHVLGRWQRSSEKAIAIKVDWANIDHCGTCSKTHEMKNPPQKPNKKETGIDDDPYLWLLCT
jgi:hypothetical protein